MSCGDPGTPNLTCIDQIRLLAFRVASAAGSTDKILERERDHVLKCSQGSNARHDRRTDRACAVLQQTFNARVEVQPS